ncbi:hypothetical protein G9A89_010767 [Geosiphon pyriformis]|nr:hypothetical protein G9A89_010767 [Geosiphon pyriformis]
MWHHQYRPLDYVFDEAFSGVIQPIKFLELFGMVFDLPIGKTAGLSALIETAHKILSKILSDRILLACSAHDILHGDNFSVLKSITTQTPIFVIGSVVEDALEKNQELWLEHLERCLVRIKMCGKFIHFFGNIHRNRTNRVMIDFSLTDGYSVHNRLDQGEESVCGYRLNSHFVSRSSHAESQAGFSTFFAAGVYVDDMIWIGSSQTATQHILNYLGIFLSTDGLSKPSLAKAHSDVYFFSNLVLKKAVSDKQFLYLVSAVLHLIKKLDSRGLIPEWFGRSVAFLSGVSSFPLALSGIGPVDICSSNGFVSVCDHLSQIGTDSLSVYTDGLVKNLGMTGCRARAAAFFENIDLGLGVCVLGLMSSTLAELQAVALALECIPVDHSVRLFLDSQAALDACKSEHWHIRNIICGKNLRVSWHKVKSHSSVLGNDCTDSIANTAALSDWFFPPRVAEQFLLADGGIVSGNSRHFVCDVFYAVCQARWEVSSSSEFLAGDLHSDVNWLASFRVWHPDLHMVIGFTSRHTADIRTYFMKAFVLCLYCGKVKVSDHVFSCVIDDVARRWVLESCMSSWKVLFGLSLSASCILQLLSACASDFLVFSTLCKGFVFKGWLQEAVSIFYVPKVAGIKIADFVCSICVTFRNDIWLVHAKHHAYMERNDLIPVDGLVSISISGLTSRFLDGVVKLLGVAEVFGVCFGFYKSCSFFSDIGDPVSINIIV